MNMIRLPELRMIDAAIHCLVRPGSMKRYMNGMTAEFQNRQDIRFEGIADHTKRGRLNIEVTYQLHKVPFLFITHDLDVMKVMFNTRVLQFSFLVEQIALGGHHQTEMRLQRVEGRLH